MCADNHVEWVVCLARHGRKLMTLVSYGFLNTNQEKKTVDAHFQSDHL